MNQKMLVGALALGGAMVSSAHAGMITESDLTLGQTSVNFTRDGVDITVTAVGGAFAQQSFQGVTGIGVGGGTFPEVDGAEELVIEFSVPVVITGIEFAHLYHLGAFGENNDESVVLELNDGAATEEFQPTASTAATWTGLGAVTNLDPSASNGGAWWSVDGADIFGVMVSKIRLTPGAPGPQGDDDDFSFVGLSFVPTPGTLAIGGLAGVAFVRRRR
jgi:hypothetical protein